MATELEKSLQRDIENIKKMKIITQDGMKRKPMVVGELKESTKLIQG